MSWTHILRQQAQFLRFSTDQRNKDLTRVLTGIRYEFSTDKYNNEGAAPLMLWRGQQMAIGELMTVKDGKEGSELYCMGYAVFRRKWVGLRGVSTASRGERSKVTGTSHVPMNGKDGADEVEGVGNTGGNRESQQEWKNDGNEEFRLWFNSIKEDIVDIAIAKRERRPNIPDQRLRRLQHRLLDLIHILDDENSRSEADFTTPCHRAAKCKCLKCEGKTACPCQHRTPCPWDTDMSKTRRGPENV